MKILKDNIGKEVYIVGYNALAMNFGKSKLQVFYDFAAAQKFLARDTAANYADISLIHGVLTKAICIPEKIDACLDIFVIIPEANFEKDSYIVKCTDLDHLQNTIIKVTSENGDIAYPSEDDFIRDRNYEEDCDISLSDTDQKDIEDLYILYGYEIELFFSFDESTLDEMLVDESKKLYKEIEHGQQN